MPAAVSADGNNLWILQGIDLVVQWLGVSENFDNHEFSYFFSSLIFAKDGR